MGINLGKDFGKLTASAALNNRKATDNSNKLNEQASRKFDLKLPFSAKLSEVAGKKFDSDAVLFGEIDDGGKNIDGSNNYNTSDHYDNGDVTVTVTYDENSGRTKTEITDKNSGKSYVYIVDGDGNVVYERGDSSLKNKAN